MFSDESITSLKNENDFGAAAKIFLEMQKRDWEQSIEGYYSLNRVQIKSFEFDGFKIKVQYNPDRLISSSANVDKDFIQKRKCFLCLENLLKGQKGFLYNKEYIILANPYPIFPEHFTIANINHFPQRISDIFYMMLSLSRSMSRYYTVFYNGPNCGASAPDHLHFQAGNKGFLPIDDDYNKLKELYGEILHEEYGFVCTAVDDGIRRFVAFEGEMEDSLIYAFNLFLGTYRSLQKTEDEPMMNILSSFEAGTGWRVIIFLREKHRPALYYSTGEDNILLSPAALDMGGVCITPREKDFTNITKDILAEILNEVCIGEELFGLLKSELKENLKKI
ncbi:MAG: DUF4922 domain-containing protein [Ignavibacteriaceae bacterium]|nr:DUF4922 domain-containing protein [Ignavibacteriaceae bacterium]